MNIIFKKYLSQHTLNAIVHLSMFSERGTQYRRNCNQYSFWYSIRKMSTLLSRCHIRHRCVWIKLKFLINVITSFIVFKYCKWKIPLLLWFYYYPFKWNVPKIHLRWIKLSPRKFIVNYFRKMISFWFEKSSIFINRRRPIMRKVRFRAWLIHGLNGIHMYAVFNICEFRFEPSFEIFKWTRYWRGIIKCRCIVLCYSFYFSTDYHLNEFYSIDWMTIECYPKENAIFSLANRFKSTISD